MTLWPHQQHLRQPHGDFLAPRLVDQARQVKKAVMTETKIMSSIEKIMDRIIDPKMQMRIALWIYQKYVGDKQPYQVPARPVDKSAYPYIPRKEYPMPQHPGSSFDDSAGTASKTTCCSDGGECKCKTGKSEE